jgi:Tol biopolymer transport system component
VRNTNARQETWVRELTSGREIRLTSDEARTTTPLWSPTGETIAFRSERRGTGDLYYRSANAAGAEALLVANVRNKIPQQWSRDGRFLVYSEAGSPTNRFHLWLLPIPQGRVPTTEKPIEFLPDESDQRHGQLSPDSRWMAYVSPEAGRPEVYVRPFPAVGNFLWKVTTQGGLQPRWRADGKELYFVALDGKMMAVSVVPSGQIDSKRASPPSFAVGTLVALFDTHITGGATPRAYQYDVTADGTRFLVATTGPSSAPVLSVEVNWNAGMK